MGVFAWAYSKKDRMVGNSAIVILLAAGVVLYACGWFFQKTKQWA